MRIIAGAWRGRRLIAPPGLDTRPTADRTRETLFSMLTSRLGGFTGLAVADLYAGSGALGLEALSRGAARCLFVDAERAAIAAIRANVAALAATTAADVRQHVLPPLPPTAAPFDLILADPPYAAAQHAALLAALIDPAWTHPGAIVALETAHGPPPAAAGLDCLVSRRVGKAALHLYRRA